MNRVTYDIAAFSQAIRTACSDDPRQNGMRQPVLHLDGQLFEVPKLTEQVEGEAAFAAGTGQKDFEKICRFVRVRKLSFKGLRVTDLAPPAQIHGLRELQIWWATKLTSIDPLARLGLRLLILEDTKRLSDLTPFARMQSLETLMYSGGVWSANLAQSLSPLADLQKLTELHLTNLKVMEGGLRPVAGCKNLRRLVLSLQFATADYAFLKAHLPGTECDAFVPYQKLGFDLDGRDVCVTRRRKPYLNSQKDAARLQRYVDRFLAMVDEFRRE